MNIYLTHNTNAISAFSYFISFRTPNLIAEDFDCNIVEALSRHLPQIVHDYIFGQNIVPSVEAAQAASSCRSAKLLSVYVVSSNKDQVTLLSRLLGCVPSRVYLMKGDDFFVTSEGRYPSMGVDRLATLRGAEYLYGCPALVFDGGTATTYTAADASGKIMGGGISPGIFTRLNSLHEGTCALPNISIEEFHTRMQKIIKQKKPLPIFATNTKDAITVGI